MFETVIEIICFTLVVGLVVAYMLARHYKQKKVIKEEVEENREKTEKTQMDHENVPNSVKKYISEAMHVQKDVIQGTDKKSISEKSLNSKWNKVQEKVTSMKNDNDNLKSSIQLLEKKIVEQQEEIDDLLATSKKYFIEVWKSKDGWRFRIKHLNGNIIASSEAYANKRNMLLSANRLSKEANFPIRCVKNTKK